MNLPPSIGNSPCQTSCSKRRRPLIHTYPFFKLQGAVFTLFIIPASKSTIDCNPDKCERSHSGIPYPKLEHFTQSLLDAQKNYDLEDLVDGMDLDDAWGVANLQLGRIPIDSINRKNELIRESPRARSS